MRGLAQTLVLTGAIKAADVTAVLERVGEGPDFGRQLVAESLVSESQLAQAIALQTGHRFVELGALTLDPSVVALVPSAVCRRYQVIPIERLRGRIVIATLDPSDLIALDDVASVADVEVEAVVVAADALQQAFERYLRSDEELSDLSAQIGEAISDSASSATENIEDVADDAPIIRFVNLLITQAINDRASDIHVEPGERELTVRFRIDGVLHEMQRADRAIQDGIISRLKIMSAIDIAERRRPQDGRLSVRHEGRQVDVRVATLPTVWGEKIVMRILDSTGETMTLSDLRFSSINQRRFEQAITRPHGMILVTGPTGSGKSTTLYTALRTIVDPKINVITVEDPVEFRIPGVSQVQVNNKAGMTFQAALRSILRSDPDVILVGEIRDKETATISVEAALTGHLLLSTLHTNDAPSAVTRLTEIGVEPFLVATALSAVVAQRLARRLCTRCRTPHTETTDVLSALGFPHDPADPPVVFRPGGCPQCSGTGYRGRVALHEVMTLSEEIEQLVVTHGTATDVRRIAIEQGMVSLRDDGWNKVAQGLTSIEEVLRVSV